ncbi:MAG: hypothetical protein WC882_03505 [Candidatus Gracilibacteria bacterium]
MSPQDFTLTREEVSEKLNISIRTLDRYIRRNYFNVKHSGRNVWISKNSFEEYYKKNYGQMTPTTDSEELSESQNVALSGQEQMTGQAYNAFGVGGLKQPLLELSAHEHAYDTALSPVYIYKGLYDELKERNDEQIKRLEGAHYRVGQLEAQVKSMIPMVEFKKQKDQLQLMDRKYRESLEEASRKLSQSKRLFEGERLNKNIYISLVYGLLALHVIFWGLLRFA